MIKARPGPSGGTSIRLAWTRVCDQGTLPPRRISARPRSPARARANDRP
jgi:hypothetical protein